MKMLYSHPRLSEVDMEMEELIAVSFDPNLYSDGDSQITDADEILARELFLTGEYE
ncbi:MAG: hypothetical protein IJT19_00660 [Bacteroidaceae bacterium]|nr:hypothetical protein [Bacteroidaceae bacterium]